MFPQKIYFSWSGISILKIHLILITYPKRNCPYVNPESQILYIYILDLLIWKYKAPL